MRIEQYFLMTDYSLSMEILLLLQLLLMVLFSQSLIDVDDLEEMDLRWSPKDSRRSVATKPQRRTTPIENSTSNALVSQCDGIGSYDWIYQVEEEPSNFTLMDITSSSSSSNNELSPSKPTQDLSHTNSPSVPNRPFAPIIEDWAPILEVTPKPVSPKSHSSSKRKTRKTCFVCRSMDHLIKDCDYHARKKAQPTPRNYAHKGNNKQNASLTYKNLLKHMVPVAVHTRSKPISITAVRPVCAVVPKITMTRPRHAHSIDTKSKSPIRRHMTRSQPQRPVIHLPELLLLRLQWLVLLRVRRENGYVDQNASF
nr:hypothetical protein [Tanacetum cinerariifolium]